MRVEIEVIAVRPPSVSSLRDTPQATEGTTVDILLTLAAMLRSAQPVSLSGERRANRAASRLACQVVRRVSSAKHWAALQTGIPR